MIKTVLNVLHVFGSNFVHIEYEYYFNGLHCICLDLTVNWFGSVVTVKGGLFILKSDQIEVMQRSLCGGE